MRIRTRGALLMDVVVSCALLSVVAYLVLTLFPSAKVFLHESQHRQRALAIARTALEELKSQPFGDLQAEPTRNLPAYTEEGVVYHPVVVIAPIAGEPPELLLRARCQVRWRDALGEHSLELGAYLLDNAP